jgi:hypothetical protein
MPQRSSGGGCGLRNQSHFTERSLTSLPLGDGRRDILSRESGAGEVYAPQDLLALAQTLLGGGETQARAESDVVSSEQFPSHRGEGEGLVGGIRAVLIG